MKTTKFVVKVNRRSTRATEYVRRIDRTPIQMTPNLKLALVMGRFTAEDAIKSIQNSRCRPELVSVQVVLSPEVVAPRQTKMPEILSDNGHSCWPPRPPERSQLASPSDLWSRRTAPLALLAGSESRQPG